MKTIQIDGEEYALVPVREERERQLAIAELKELYTNAMKYPDLNCEYPLDALTFHLRSALGPEWKEFILLLKAEVLNSLMDNDSVFPDDMEESERPYLYSEYMEEILPRYMSRDVIDDLFGGDI